MNTTELVRAIFSRLIKYKLVVLATGIILATLLFFYAKTREIIYTSRATIFPLTTSSENALSGTALSGILGLSDAPKSFSSEATINILELTSSRNIREAVAATRLPAFGNKTITELLVQSINKAKPLFSDEIKIPADSVAQAVLGGELLRPAITAKMSKNGVLELYYSNADKNLITPVSFAIIDKLSAFYIDLKIKKAAFDYSFTINKIDSLEMLINAVDRKAIRLENTTFFVPQKLEYEIPKDKVNSEKTRYMRQREIAFNNKEEANWRLQKATPVISLLDKPTEPFTVAKPSYILYAVMGFTLGSLLAVFLLLAGLLYKYVRYEISRNIFGTDARVTNNL